MCVCTCTVYSRYRCPGAWLPPDATLCRRTERHHIVACTAQPTALATPQRGPGSTQASTRHLAGNLTAWQTMAHLGAGLCPEASCPTGRRAAPRSRCRYMSLFYRTLFDQRTESTQYRRPRPHGSGYRVPRPSSPVPSPQSPVFGPHPQSPLGLTYCRLDVWTTTLGRLRASLHTGMRHSPEQAPPLCFMPRARTASAKQRSQPASSRRLKHTKTPLQ